MQIKTKKDLFRVLNSFFNWTKILKFPEEKLLKKLAEKLAENGFYFSEINADYNNYIGEVIFVNDKADVGIRVICQTDIILFDKKNGDYELSNLLSFDDFEKTWTISESGIELI